MDSLFTIIIADCLTLDPLVLALFLLFCFRLLILYLKGVVLADLVDIDFDVGFLLNLVKIIDRTLNSMQFNYLRIFAKHAHIFF